MDQATIAAQAMLDEKKMAHRLHLENTLTSVRQLISTGKIEQAGKLSEELEHSALWEETKQAFLDAVPDICDKCGGPINKIIMALCGVRVIWNCHACVEAEMKAHAEAMTTARLEAIARTKRRIEANIESILTSCGVSKRYVSAKLADFPESAGRYAATDDGLYFTGDRGTGKTHLAVAIMRDCLLNMELAISGDVMTTRTDRITASLPWKPRFVSIPDLLLQIRATFKDPESGDGSSEAEIIEKYSSVNLLVLDDLGVEKTSEWSMQTLYTIIDRRYRDIKRTIITSNLTLDEITKKLDDRISSRIAGMCQIVPLKGKDRRLTDRRGV